MTYLHKGIDTHNCQVWLGFGIVNQIEVNQFLQLKIVGLHTVHHVGEQHRHVFSDGHSSNHFLDCIFLLALVQAGKVFFILMYFT